MSKKFVVTLAVMTVAMANCARMKSKPASPITCTPAQAASYNQAFSGIDAIKNKGVSDESEVVSTLSFCKDLSAEFKAQASGCFDKVDGQFLPVQRLLSDCAEQQKARTAALSKSYNPLSSINATQQYGGLAYP